MFPPIRTIICILFSLRCLVFAQPFANRHPPQITSADMDSAMLFERLWNGNATMEEWTASVSNGNITHIAENIISIHSTYFCGAVTVIRTDEGLVFIDTARPESADLTLALARSWDDSPIHTVIYTHGHIDHTSGISAIDKEADARGLPRPRIVAHRNVERRLQRYETAQGYNSIIQGQQFNQPGYVYPIGQRRPDKVYDTNLTLSIGGEQLELFHARGETDDATFVWLPRKRVLVSGDFVTWVFPNAGNPRKVQRFAPEWGPALRHMEGLAPAVLIPGHGPVIFGEQRSLQVLRDGAAAMEILTNRTLEMLNKGAPLNEIIRAVKIPAEYLAKTYLLPKYDDPEFVVRGIYHYYAGWFDGNPASMKPAADAELAVELAKLTGGAEKLAQQALALSQSNRTRLAVHLVEFAADAEPENKEIQAMRSTILQKQIDSETSLMAKGFLSVYQRDAVSKSGA